MIVLVALSVLSGTPKTASEGWDTLPGLSAPLGRVGDVIAAPPAGGLPGDEKVVVARYEGCDRDQAVSLSKFIAGVALGGNQILNWVKQNQLEKVIFKETEAPLASALDRAREGAFTEGERCGGKTGKQGWKLQSRGLPKQLCAKTTAQGEGEFWFARPNAKPDHKGLTAEVRVSPAAAETKDKCRIRLSAALFDRRGKARLQYHADYGGVLEVQLLGDACDVDFVFNAAEQAFHARPSGRCPPLRKKPG